MSKLLLRIFVAGVTWLLASASYADPIQDLTMQNYEAGWYPNYWQGYGPLTCRRTCAVWVGGVPESEFATDLIDDFQRTSVCKVTRDPAIIEKPINDPLSHWLYGNQFDDKPVCYIGTPYGVKEDDHYMCLCVCNKPDLIVSHIYDPVWDSGTGQSIIVADITNIGALAAPISQARLVDLDTLANDVQATPAIPAGGTVSVAFTLGYWVFDPDAVLEVTTDFTDIVDECNENNNTLIYAEQG
ncbi:CARDB domain-containing protein [Microbulbifer sp. SSSA002]|uniref:CARDB domain-containing protein n=1 Tax=unclassified Microbulbifer TaxID=2619833 RepID=UPI004039CD09